MLIPIARPFHKKLVDGDLILAGDIGGTKADLAVFLVKNGQLELIKERQYSSGDYASFEELIQDFYGEEAIQVNRVSLGVAGPVYKERVRTTNLPWELSTSSISRCLKVDNVHLLNDLEANAYGIAMLNENDIHTIYQATVTPEGNIAVIAPGTGLGEAGMYWDGKNLHPFATEGGHAGFSPGQPVDLAFFRFLQKKFGHVSWERVLSGPGITNIFCFLVEGLKRNLPTSLHNEIKRSSHPSLIITRTALNGQCEVCNETLQMFTRYLGEESANLCLKVKATGGLFIGGGIVPDIINEDFDDVFMRAFLNNERMKPLLEEVPVRIIMNEKTALLGAAFYGA